MEDTVRTDQINTISHQDIYSARLGNEIANFENDVNVHDLPDIYNVFSGNFLRGVLESELNASTLLEWWRKEIETLYRKLNRKINILSLASGNGDLEISLLKGLDRSVKYSFTGIDVNPVMLERAKNLALDEFLPNVNFVLGDLNNPEFSELYDVVIAHHSLHHIIELESLFDELAEHSTDDMIFLIFDMIGRNGHKMWPSTKQVVDLIWKSLPDKYKYNHYYSRTDQKIMDVDCSEECFEGIRAEDILPALRRYFDLDFFFPFATLINPFIDRAYGHNFNPDSPEDVQFIKSALDLDKSFLKEKVLAPTQAFMKCVKKGSAASERFLFQTPTESIKARKSTIDISIERKRILEKIHFPGEWK